MARVREGDDRALGTIYDRHASLVFTVTRAIVGGEADAEEVSGDVFVQLWNQGDRFDPTRGSLRLWLATIARSRALDHVRGRDRRQAAHLRSAERDAHGVAVEIAGTEPTDERTIVSEIRDALDRGLADLNVDQRRAIELAYFGGLSQSEIAVRLGEPLGTVKTRIRDGMSKLRECFAPTRGVSA